MVHNHAPRQQTINQDELEVRSIVAARYALYGIVPIVIITVLLLIIYTVPDGIIPKVVLWWTILYIVQYLVAYLATRNIQKLITFVRWHTIVRTGLYMIAFSLLVVRTHMTIFGLAEDNMIRVVYLPLYGSFRVVFSCMIFYAMFVLARFVWNIIRDVVMFVWNYLDADW